MKGQGTIAVNNAYINGTVNTEMVVDIIAILAPGSGSPPYASGKTTVFIPSGIAVAKNVKYIGAALISSPNAELASKRTPIIAPTMIRGRAVNLNADAT